ncbi:hypothetical protein RHGRI_008648 [Rhododendron griersonianum]|uniref:C2 domain-containing protein n=1 Tax=Rhododendron griersonianum TaxID=479676 RepID=A0AAV6L0Y1_9ERIC|nr:hypothetical protein RHGRI_008648 [Rhododendron griersonianum]
MEIELGHNSFCEITSSGDGPHGGWSRRRADGRGVGVGVDGDGGEASSYKRLLPRTHKDSAAVADMWSSTSSFDGYLSALSPLQPPPPPQCLSPQRQRCEFVFHCKFHISHCEIVDSSVRLAFYTPWTEPRSSRARRTSWRLEWCGRRKRQRRWQTLPGRRGVLEANFIEPTHNKQDFEKTSVFQKLEYRLKEMTWEYWGGSVELVFYTVKLCWTVKKSDPMAVVYTKGRYGTLQEIGRTEVVLNSLNPKWITKHAVTYHFEVVQTLVFCVYDVDTQFHNLDVKGFAVAVKAGLTKDDLQGKDSEVKFDFDAIDETDRLEEALKPRVESMGGTLEKVLLTGNHVTPCIQEPRWQPGYLYTPADAIAQRLKTLTVNDTRVLSRTISNWFSRLEEK